MKANMQLQEVKKNQISEQYEEIVLIDNKLSQNLGKKNLEIYWENIQIEATIQHEKKLIKKMLIKNIKGIGRSGDLTSIIGPSGCGKTTLLNFLSGRLFSPNLSLSGQIKINGVNCNDMSQLGEKIAYVMQDDVLCPVFTPREAFLFAAAMRLKISEEERVKKVDELIVQLGLTKCQNSLIGNELIRGISGGEKKRTSIGVELLTDPLLLFLDEPTTGLDSTTAQNVIQLLQNLTKNHGMNIITTIHQPNSQIFSMFDKLILMVDGHIIYQGKSDLCIDYFSNIGFQCPPFYNPADYLMKCMNIEGLWIDKIKQGQELNFDELNLEFEQRINFMVNNFLQSSQYRQITHIMSHKNELDQEIKIREQVSMVTQFRYLIWRNFNIMTKDKFKYWAQLIQILFLSGFILILFNNLGTDQASIFNRNGLFFFCSINCLFLGINSAVQLFTSELPLFKREVLNKSYGVFPYFLAKNILNIPFYLFLSLVFSLIVSFGCSLQASGFFIFFITFHLSLMASQGYGQMMAIIIQNEVLVNAIIPATVIPLFLFSGFFFNLNDNKYYFKVFEYISLPKYTFASFAINEFTRIQFNCLTYCNPLQQYNFDITNSGANLLVLLGYIIFYHSLACFVMNRVSKPKALIINQCNQNKQYQELKTEL